MAPNLSSYITGMCISRLERADQIRHGEENSADLKVLPLGQGCLDNRAEEVSNACEMMELALAQRKSRLTIAEEDDRIYDAGIVASASSSSPAIAHRCVTLCSSDPTSAILTVVMEMTMLAAGRQRRQPSHSP